MTDLQIYLSTKAGSNLTFDGLEFQAWSLAKNIIVAAESQQVSANESDNVTTLHMEPEGTVRITRLAREHCVLLDFTMTSAYWPTTVDTLYDIQYEWRDEEVTLIVGAPFPGGKRLYRIRDLLDLTSAPDDWPEGDPRAPRPAPRRPGEPPVFVLPRLAKRLDPNQMELPLFS